MLKPIPHYINGQFVEDNNRLISVLNPATEEMIQQIPIAAKDTVDQAVKAARLAFESWSKKPQHERGKIVRQLADLMENEKDEFAAVLMTEQGKPYKEAYNEIAAAIEFLRYISEWNRKIGGDQIPSDDPNEWIILKKNPIGVVAGIIPWNFPMFILARKVGTALITGCTIVVKPSEITPVTTHLFAKLLDKHGIVPSGVVNIVYGDGTDTGTFLVKHPEISLISMTGSVKTGSKIMALASENLTKVNLELGGKAPAIVTQHADLDLAVKSITRSRIMNAGQTCICAERVYVHESVYHEFLSKLTENFKNLRQGPSAKENDYDLGPLVSKVHYSKVKEMLEAAKKEGATVAFQSEELPSQKGFFFPPVILTDVTDDMAIMKDEIFGPVLPVTTYSNREELLKAVNNSEYGLSSSLYTDNVNEALFFVDRLDYGETYVNRENGEAIQGYHAGRKKSGIGGTDGYYGIQDFLETQVVYLRYKN